MGLILLVLVAGHPAERINLMDTIFFLVDWLYVVYYSLVKGGDYAAQFSHVCSHWRDTSNGRFVASDKINRVMRYVCSNSMYHNSSTIAMRSEHTLTIDAYSMAIGVYSICVTFYQPSTDNGDNDYCTLEIRLSDNSDNAHNTAKWMAGIIDNSEY